MKAKTIRLEVLIEIPDDYPLNDLLCEIANGIEQNTKILKNKGKGIIKYFDLIVSFGVIDNDEKTN